MNKKVASSQNGSWSNKVVTENGTTTIGASWKSSCSVVDSKVNVIITVTFKSIGGDWCTYEIWADGESKASNSSIPHYQGNNYSLTYSFSVDANSSKSTSKEFQAWIKTTNGQWIGFGRTTTTLTYEYEDDKPYSITYNANGGEGTMETDYCYADAPFLTKQNSFTRYGYIFAGWNEAADKTSNWWNIPGYTRGVKTDGSSGSAGVYETGKSWVWSYDHNITLYAVWVPITVTVTFNSNTTDTSVNNTFTAQTYEVGAEGIYFKGTITRSHYDCIGWALEVDSATATYSLNSWVVNLFITENAPSITLYAVWKEKTKHTLTINKGTSTASVELYPDEEYTLPTSAPTKANISYSFVYTYDKVEEAATISRSADDVTLVKSYVFSEWNTASDGSSTNYTLGEKISISSNTTLYPQFSENETWTYESEKTAQTAFPTGTLEQMTLAGWVLSKESTVTLAFPQKLKYNATMYALWTPDGAGGFLKYYVTSDTEPQTSFAIGSKVRIVGLKDSENDAQYTVASVTKKEVEAGKWSIAVSFEENFITNGQQKANEKNVQIWGEGSYIPDFDYICSKDNRLWGCCNSNRTIYASALGDPTDFWTFEGDTLDAYQVAVASANKFTGIIALNSQIAIMKQHTIHKMLGSYPSEYTLYEYNFEGTEKNNGGSLVNVENAALFLSEHGLASYSGSSVTSIDDSLGTSQKSNALAMYDGEKYFLHFKDADNNDKTYVYDTRYGMWIQEEYGEVLSFAHYSSDNYVLVKEEKQNKILKITSGETYDAEWEIIFKPFIETISTTKTTTHIFEKKRYTKLTLRVELPEGSYIKAEGLYDGAGEWHLLGGASGTKDGVCDIVINTPRVDKLQLKLSGLGAMTILAMERSYQVYSRR